MRSAWPLLLALLAALGAGWFVFTAEEAPGGLEGELSAGADTSEDPKPVERPAPLQASGVVVLEDVPSDLREFHHEPGSSLLEDPEVLERRVKVAGSEERTTGDVVLRALARGLGSDHPFHFADQASLDRFRSVEFEDGFPAGNPSVAELLSMAPRAGFRFFERDGQLYMFPLPDDE